jgi:hypothetical protein
MNVVMVHHANIDEATKKHKGSSILTMDRHSKVGPEELSRKWDRISVCKQQGIHLQ